MSLIPRLTSLWRNLFHKDRVDQEFTEEIQAYLDMLTEKKIRQGLPPREARRSGPLDDRRSVVAGRQPGGFAPSVAT